MYIPLPDCPQVRAIHAYQAEQPDELALREGDVVKVLRKLPDGMFFVDILCNGDTMSLYCLTFRLIWQYALSQLNVKFLQFLLQKTFPSFISKGLEDGWNDIEVIVKKLFFDSNSK